jgi:hypothetical protein
MQEGGSEVQCGVLFTREGASGGVREWREVRSSAGVGRSRLLVHTVLDEGGSDAVNVAVRMCWVGFDGALHHYRCLARRINATSGASSDATHSTRSVGLRGESSGTDIVSETVSGTVIKSSESSHLETTSAGHAFVFFLERQRLDERRPMALEDISSEDFICVYKLGTLEEPSKRRKQKRRNTGDVERRSNDENEEAEEKKVIMCKRVKIAEPLVDTQDEEQELVKLEEVNDELNHFDEMNDEVNDERLGTLAVDDDNDGEVQPLDDETEEGGEGEHVLTIRVDGSGIKVALSYNEAPPCQGPPVTDSLIEYQPSQICGFTVYR